VKDWIDWVGLWALCSIAIALLVGKFIDWGTK